VRATGQHSPGGKLLALNRAGVDGRPRRIVLPFDVVASLLMTLPRMMQAALDARFPDGSLRFVQRPGTWQIEEAAGNADLILKLGTPDGFEVAFALNEPDADSLGAALLKAPDTGQTRKRRPN
jgi:hypothetical protein